MKINRKIVQKELDIDKTLSYLRLNIRDQLKAGKGTKMENALLDIEMNKKPTEFDAYFDGTGICYTQYESVARKKKASNNYDSYIREMVKYARAMGVNFNALRDKTVAIYFNSSSLA